jgi:hypothetical protein
VRPDEIADDERDNGGDHEKRQPHQDADQKATRLVDDSI